MYWLKVYELPQGSRAARGSPIVNLLPLEEDERISAVLPVPGGFEQAGYVLMATRRGRIKKTPLEDFSRPRTSGIIAIDLVDEDRLIGVALTNGQRQVMLASSGGKVVRFEEAHVRSMGRVSRGVIGMRIPANERIISLIIVDSGLVLTATENGYGKCTRIEEYPTKGRGGKGVISVQTSARNGSVVGAMLVNQADEMMLITNGGKLVRTRVGEVSVLSRNTQGVKLISLTPGERLVAVERVAEEE